MALFSIFKKKQKPLDVEVAGIAFSNPVGLFPSDSSLSGCLASKAGFVTFSPPKTHVIDWITGLKTKSLRCPIAVNVNFDIIRTFSLVYDFADFIIVDPDSDNGIGAADIADTSNLLDELTSLRLCYERYTPVFLRFSHGTSEDEIRHLLSACRLCGLDGVVVSGVRMLSLAREITLGRLPLIAVASTPEDALLQLEQGASLVEAHMRPAAVLRTIQTLENQEPKQI